MQLLKKLDLPQMRVRYRTYRKTHTVYAFLFLFALLLGAVAATRFLLSPTGVSAHEVFCAHWETRAGSFWEFTLWGFFSLLPFLLFALASGITVYAPLCNALFLAVCAFFAGGYLRFLLPVLEGNGTLFSFFIFLLTLLAPGFVLIAASAFSTAVSFRVFSPASPRDDPEYRAFGGTLFCGPFFARTINVRFLSSYLLCYFVFSCVLFGTCALQAVLTRISL